MSFSLKTRKSSLLLLGCIIFFSLGISFLFMGALIHINPGVQHFAGFFHQESLMNLVYSMFPAIR